jgi:hypothetical protein
MPDHATPLPAGVTRWKWICPDLIDLVAARLLAPHDVASAIDGVSVADAFAFVSYPKHRCSVQRIA